MNENAEYFVETPRSVYDKMARMGDLDNDPIMGTWAKALRALFNAGYADEPCLFRIDWEPMSVNGRPAHSVRLEFPDNPQAQAVYDSVPPLAIDG